MAYQSYQVTYSVPEMSQPTASSCWATAFTMLINYVKGTQYSPADIAQAVGKTLDEGDDNATDYAVAQAFGLQADACTCMDLDGWGKLLQSYGPLYIGINGNSHAVLVTGMTTDGTADTTTFYINDPWDGPVTKTYAELTQMYENIDDETEFWICHQ